MFLLLLSVFLPAAFAADTACTSQGGHCQIDTNACAGSYATGLCDGAANRKCCLPHAGSCTAEEKTLACQLFHSSAVMAFQAHPSGVHDNAFPYNNLRDMCNGLQASRSHYTCSECPSPGAPGGFVCLSANLLKYLVHLASAGHVTINELAGACHTCSSFHYRGLAVDLGIGDHRNAEYINTCKSMGGNGWDEGNHVHCQFTS